MRPKPFQNREWLDLREIFVFSKSGMKSGNDPVFASASRDSLRSKVSRFLRARRNIDYDQSLETYYCYRPLDRRWFYNDLRMLNRPGPELQKAWGANNIGLYAIPTGTGAGPAVWCYGLLPDYHAFRGSYDGYAFPLHDRRPDVNSPNVSPDLLQSLSRAYGEAVAAEDVFDAILCLLSATSYSLRFAEDLEDVFPHVPFPGRPERFHESVRVGREIRAVETFGREPDATDRGEDFVRVETQPRGSVAEVQFGAGEITLCDDGSGRIVAIPQAVWDFAVSGYRVVPRWLQARVGLDADFALVQEFRDICARVAELIVLFEQADVVLETVLNETLSREALGLEPEE
jgi:predicted helicase